MTTAALDALWWLVLAVELALALPVAYLCLLTIAARRGATRPSVDGRDRLRDQPRAVAPAHARSQPPRFAVLVPAHDEAAVLGTLLTSLGQLDYPRERFTVYVIADNCRDDTAELARAHRWVGVYERNEPDTRGKGYALRWMLAELARAGLLYDAYVIVDADSVVNAGFLRALAEPVVAGEIAVQARYTVSNADEAPSAALRWLGLALVNHVRPLGRTTLGGSATLAGNGMCLSASLLARYPWEAHSLTEDYEYYLSIVQQGMRVCYAPRAVVASIMPTTFRELGTQDIRWEATGAGRQQTASGIAWHLLYEGLRQRDVVRLDALAEFLTPPLSLLGACAVLLLAVALLLRAPVQIGMALGLLVGLAWYSGSPFVLLRPPASVYRALLFAPWFVVRKVWIVLVVRHSKRKTSAWVRTSRGRLAK